jgi:hypothetical protein
MESCNPYDEAKVWAHELGEMSDAPYSDHTSHAPTHQQTLLNDPYHGAMAGSDKRARTHNVSQSSSEWPQNRHNHKKSVVRMPKTQAVAMARTLKKSVVVASIAVFGILSGAVATHLQSPTTSQSTSASQNRAAGAQPSSTSSSDSSNASSHQSSSSASAGGFFNQQGGGYGFANGGSAQPPVSSSHVSPSR